MAPGWRASEPAPRRPSPAQWGTVAPGSKTQARTERVDLRFPGSVALRTPIINIFIVNICESAKGLLMLAVHFSAEKTVQRFIEVLKFDFTNISFWKL